MLTVYRFAERLCVKESELPSTGWEVRSGGLTDEYEPPNSPASAEGISAMQRHGIDMSAHRSTLLDATALRSAAYIYCVSARHQDWIASVARDVAPRVKTLGSDIPDPWHQEQPVYDACAMHMLGVVPALLEKDFGTVLGEKK